MPCDHVACISTAACSLPDDIRYKIIFTKYLVTKNFEIRLLIIVDGDEDHPVIGQQFAGQFEARIHHRQPAGVKATSKAVFEFADLPHPVFVQNPDIFEIFLLIPTEIILIGEIVVSGVIGRVDIDHLDSFAIGFLQHPQYIEIIPLDEDISGFVEIAIDAVFRDQRLVGRDLRLEPGSTLSGKLQFIAVFVIEDIDMFFQIVKEFSFQTINDIGLPILPDPLILGQGIGETLPEAKKNCLP